MIRQLLRDQDHVCSCPVLTFKTLRLYMPTFVQAAAGDRHPMPLEPVHVVGPDIDIDVDKQVRQLGRS